MSADRDPAPPLHDLLLAHACQALTEASAARRPAAPLSVTCASPAGSVQVTFTPAAAGPAVFVPTAFQEAVLAALAGRALRTDPLAKIVGDRRRLFREKGALPELQEQGLVGYHPRLGYYRPDDPPAEIAGDAGDAGAA